ncbi:amidase, Asp-tRNAAsn/Glu-tRNAGln amidotransferase A subunit [Belliella baltica DSM 15883]|uniref:Amidase, Asp-tRNAAsn/Glu-tRNAGln amidotransferase A subunit n=1 Tax=Belliella baltica (strain DSM 15883 / CIP 108006 / LMG 21964 / BA134) TaxID=866536 RepID=I3Z2K3_BELBD|nr:amidase [Belliella baltica]AFL83471.1 amidase, Asp-tRNAAsn/Glu-tRNAGln amidotransferase A subunit [Belliella baltica DSM 15883]
MKDFTNTPRLGIIILVPALLLVGFIAGKKIGEINPQAIEGAESLIGISFSPAEKDSMVGNLVNYRNGYENMRKTKIENSVSPSLPFNPLPHGFFPNQNQEENNWGLPSNVTLPENDHDIAFLSVAELSTLIKTQKISSERLTRIYLNRIKTFGDTLQSVITVLETEALAQAKAMDAEIKAGKYRGPLHGIPYGIKDLFAVKGTKTTWGAMPYKDQVIDETATVVHKLNDAGGVLLAKFTLGALAMGDVWYGGVTKNPWNLNQGASGSSAGSASSVSAGLVPYALGTETLGSIVSPSTRNGVTGLRPTYGRVSKHGAMALSWSMDKIGPISRSALDNGIILSILNGVDKLDKSTIPAALNYNATKSVKDLKIGYFEDFFEGTRPTNEIDRRVLEDLREMGLTLYPVKLETSVDVSSMLIMLYAEGAAAFDDMTRLGQDDLLVGQRRNAWPNLFRSARFIPAVEYIQASRLRSILIEEMHALFQEYDVIVTPSYGGSQLQITNLTGHPALCMPNGFLQNGSPVSITFLANLFDEEKLIMLGRAYQEITDWQKKRPPLFNQ